MVRVNELARQLGVRRHTVAALLRRNGVESRNVGLPEDQVTEACRPYRDGWSLARLGDKLGLANLTVRRYLLLAGVLMRSPNDRQSCKVNRREEPQADGSPRGYR